MRLTTKSFYGVRALIHLAFMYDTGAPVSLKNMSGKEKISSVYLEQIFNQLKKRTIIRSVRGPKGGYILCTDPSEISVYDVIMALEGSISPGNCVSRKGRVQICENAGKCAPQEIWDEIAGQTKKTLEKYSLQDLARRTAEIDPEKKKKVLFHGKSLY